jgi:hypothetical protein
MKLEENKSIKEIWEYANKVYNENISYSAFQRHFRYHVEEIIKASKRASRLRTRVLREELYKDIKIAQQLRRNLEICSEKIESLLKQERLSREDEKTLLDFLGETRQTINLLLQWSSKINIEPMSEEKIFERIIACMSDFPIEYIQKFKERWNAYESSK